MYSIKAGANLCLGLAGGAAIEVDNNSMSDNVCQDDSSAPVEEVYVAQIEALYVIRNTQSMHTVILN